MKNDSLFSSSGQFLSLFPGKFGVLLRVAFYYQTIKKVSHDFCIEFGSYFSHSEIEIGEGVYIGAYCIIGKAKIGKHSTIGSFVNILSGKNQHDFDIIDKPIQEQAGVFKQIKVGDNCWIGNNTIIMTDVGKQAIIGAGSVVIKNVHDYSVWAGNPAKFIRNI